jgi:hypothetical protein
VKVLGIIVYENADQRPLRSVCRLKRVAPPEADFLVEINRWEYGASVNSNYQAQNCEPLQIGREYSIAVPHVGLCGTGTRFRLQSDAKASGCDLAAKLCTKLAACAPFLLKAVYGDVTTCSDRLTLACTEQSRSTGSGMTANNLQHCADALDTAACKDVFANNVPACTFHGTLPDGATCGDGSQCVSGFCSQGGSLCGVCAAKGAAGSACPSGSNDECQTGLVCSSGKICAQPAAVGLICDDTTQPCLTGLFCTAAAKTCALTVPAGQDCPGAYFNFVDGTLCSAKSSAANPQVGTQIGTASAGQPCGLAPGNGSPATLCAPGSVAACSRAPDGILLLGIPTKGLCKDPRDDGFTCTATDICQPGAQCISGFCRIPSGRYCQQPVDAGS